MLNHTIEKRQLVKFGIVLSLISLIMISANKLAAADDHHRHHSNLLYPPDAVVFGKKMNEWSAEWWQYILSTPSNPNPLLDLTGNNCTLVQYGPVWFFEGLSGVSGTGPANPVVTRTCSIPENTALFFPLINAVNYNTTDQPITELRAQVAGCIKAANNLSLSVDGQPISSKYLSRLRVRSVPFVAVFPVGGVPAIPPTPAGIYSPTVDDGYYAMLRPLSLGQHTVRFTAATPGCDHAPTDLHVPGWHLDVTYNLTVKPVVLK